MKKIKFLLFFLLCCIKISLFAQLTLRITKIPMNTPSGDQIYIAGTFNNWNPSDTSKILKKDSAGVLSVTLNIPAGTIQYKYTRGSWTTVEGGDNGSFLPNRSYIYDGSKKTFDETITSWEGQATSNSTAAANVSILDNAFFMPQLNRTRRIWLYLPPNYKTDTTQRYPVMYMHDGQNLFDKSTSFAGEWQIDETLNQLAANGDKGCIVVGIDNGGAKRLDELSPWINAQYGGGEGASYTKFIVETLKPYIDIHFRTLKDRNNTAIGGSSMGGLISVYAVIEYQNIFSKAAILSPAFWFSDSCYAQVKLKKRQQPIRFYFVSGTNESTGMVPDMQQMATTLSDVGFKPDEISFNTRSDGQHAEWFWAREFPDAYKWLFRTTATATQNVDIVKVRVYPNPSDSILNIEGINTIQYINLEIDDLYGRMMSYQPMRNNTIDVNYLIAGQYILRGVRGIETMFSIKFTKL